MARLLDLLGAGGERRELLASLPSDCASVLNHAQAHGGDPKETVRQHLSGRTAGRWLLVVDNADDEDMLFRTAGISQGIADYLPNSKDGLTLYTTRHRQIAVSLAGKEFDDLQTMTNKEAESFLRTLLTREVCTDQHQEFWKWGHILRNIAWRVAT